MPEEEVKATEETVEATEEKVETTETVEAPQEEAATEETPETPEAAEAADESEEPKLAVNGDVEVDLEDPNGVAPAVKDSISEAKDIREEERGAPSVSVPSGQDETPKEAASVVVRTKSNHKRNVNAFFEQQAHKKKLAEEKK